VPSRIRLYTLAARSAEDAYSPPRAKSRSGRTNLLFLRPGTREYLLEHLARDWPELVPYYEELYRGRAYLGSAEAQPVRKKVSALARRFGVADRRDQPLELAREPEQLELAL
jgi:hypothetical protein